MREIWLLRHGEAAAYASGGDAARPLTMRGHAQASSVGRALKARGAAFNVVLHSPYVRARETAADVCEVIGHRSTEHAGITPSGDPAAIAIELRAREEERILVVSHQPFLPRLAMELLNHNVQLDIPTACLTQIALLGERGVLRSHVPCDPD